MKKINVITGHYGAGKSSAAAALAVKLADEGEKVSVVDIDIVNPYFRTADLSELFESKGIKLYAPMFAGSNLDIPVLNFDIEQMASDDGYVIIDVGGDDSGAVALGRYSEILHRYSNVTDMLYVINKYRFLTHSPEETLRIMYEIEASSRLKHTGIINNSNLGSETTESTIEASVDFADAVSLKSKLPVMYTICRKGLHPDVPECLETEIYVKPVWA